MCKASPADQMPHGVYRVMMAAGSVFVEDLRGNIY